ncbi:acyl-CoA dehydrogenase family protein [Citricoccus alkalitolerans]|uniref:Acyl-CoA dehydrogenase family protein n=1 Tax=Citricoccus alkalitolerans TaxID=246603 RepID=A0ABV8XZ36_9MICC
MSDAGNTNSGGPTPFIGSADFYGYSDLLTSAERDVLARLRHYLAEEAEPVLAGYWERGETPLFLRDGLTGLDLVEPAELRDAGEAVRSLFIGFRNLEFSRVDGSLAILFGGQAGMFRTIVRTGGSDEQLEAWDDAIAGFRMTGCFALTEPDHGSDIARGVQTEARRAGEGWVLNGAKRWIGNAAFSEYVAVAAKDTDDGQVKVFLARTDDPGLEIAKIEGKTSLRMVHNADIGLRDVRVPETHRLQRINSFADLNRAFETLRPDVVWNATGLQIGLYETVLAYAKQREQFGRPIASFQLVQDHLVTMLGNANASLALAVRLSQLADAGGVSGEQAALAKTWVCRHMRQSAALGRELLGGNGILLEHKAARFHADAESLYTFEGTDQINTLIVGRAITGHSAFL